MKNLEMFISIYKNWPENVRVGGSLSMQKFMEMEETLMDNNEEVIESLSLLEVDENQNKVSGLGMFYFYFAFQCLFFPSFVSQFVFLDVF
jgi:hypothetical protein